MGVLALLCQYIISIQSSQNDDNIIYHNYFCHNTVYHPTKVVIRAISDTGIET